MLFRLINIDADSRAVTFIFENDDTFQLRVKAPKGDMFTLYALYYIRVSRNLPLEYMSFSQNYSSQHCSNMGVVTRKTRNSVHIASGSSHWMFPRAICSLNPGVDVWISISLLESPH